MTTIAPTNAYTVSGAYAGNAGGYLITGLIDNDGSGLVLRGYANTATPTDAMVIISGAKSNGTGVQALTGTEKVLSIRNNTTEVVGITATSLAVTGTLSATGTITSTKDGVVLSRTGASTGYQTINLANTGADCYVGPERSTGSGLLNGSTGYSLILTNASNAPVQIGSNNVVVATFKQGSSLALENATTATGIGITFPATQSASSNANTLDDYEEGTWTPALFDAETGGNSFTMSTQDGLYTKIGNVVTAYFRAAWSSKGSASGTMYLRGFPFAAKSNTGGYYYSGAVIPVDTQTTIGVVAGSTLAIILDTSGGLATAAEFSASNTGTGLNGCVTYLAN
jgi:hypothetical protein